jgi:hypothetical protein
MVRRDGGLVTGGQEDSSFSEEKEAKRLYPFTRVPVDWHACKRINVFWFFFSKKNRFLP